MNRAKEEKMSGKIFCLKRLTVKADWKKSKKSREKVWQKQKSELPLHSQNTMAS